LTVARNYVGGRLLNGRGDMRLNAHGSLTPRKWGFSDEPSHGNSPRFSIGEGKVRYVSLAEHSGLSAEEADNVGQTH